MLERASLFLLGGGAYAALELAWRGTTHWTMFLTGGVCLCLLQALADRPLPLGPAAAVGAAGVSGLELAVGAVCRRVLHTAVWDYADESKLSYCLSGIIKAWKAKPDTERRYPP